MKIITKILNYYKLRIDKKKSSTLLYYLFYLTNKNNIIIMYFFHFEITQLRKRNI